MNRSCARLILAWLVLTGCKDGGAADSAETGDTGDGDGDGDGDLPEPAEGWVSDFVEAGGTFDCDATEAEIMAAGAASVTVGDATLYVGAEENNQNEQDAVIARYDGGTLTYCVYSETEGPNGIGLGLTWDGGPIAYVVYATYAAGSGFENLGGWLAQYGPGSIDGVGARATVLGRVDAETGALNAATFIIAATDAEEVADFVASSAPTVLADGSVEQLGSTQERPIDADAETIMTCGAAGPHTGQYVFAGDLATLVCASASDCTSMSECP
jgi:hypothetical protein